MVNGAELHFKGRLVLFTVIIQRVINSVISVLVQVSS